MDSTVNSLNVGSKKRRILYMERRRAERAKKYADSDPTLTFLKRAPKPCQHNSKNLKCESLNWHDVASNRRSLYDKSGKVKQDLYLTQHISAYEPVRRRVLQEQKKIDKTVSLTYFLRSANSKKMVPVCKKFFCFVFGISSHRVLGIGKSVAAGSVPSEKRGGNHKAHLFAKKREGVREFIGNLNCSESHYGRNKSVRVYLPAGVTVRKLAKAYNNTAQPDMKATYSFFYEIFVHDFNIGVSSPATDVCGTCTRLKNEIRVAKRGSEAQNSLMTELRIHKLRANAFYELMREAKTAENSVAFVFDLQQVHPLPKTPIGDAFYRRQIAFYTFCCVGIDSRDPTFYTWTEVQAGRGAIQIGSGVLHHLRNLDFAPSVEKVLLFCDGCGGQNKNSHILHTLSYWLQKESPSHIQSIHVTFPVRGHSFLPADRVFGRAEKILKNIPVISNPEQYEAVYSQVGTVLNVGVDWQMFNVKELEETYSKANGISQAKRVTIKKIKNRNGQGFTTKVRFQAHFRFDSETEAFRSIVKRSKKEENVTAPSAMPLGRSLAREKKNDVVHLLETHYGQEWKDIPDLQWFLPHLYGEQVHHEVHSEDTHLECNCLDPEANEVHF